MGVFVCVCTCVCISVWCMCMYATCRSEDSCGNQISPSAIFCCVGSEVGHHVEPRVLLPIAILPAMVMFIEGDVLIVRQEKVLRTAIYQVTGS